MDSEKKNYQFVQIKSPKGFTCPVAAPMSSISAEAILVSCTKSCHQMKDTGGFSKLFCMVIMSSTGALVGPLSPWLP